MVRAICVCLAVIFSTGSALTAVSPGGPGGSAASKALVNQFRSLAKGREQALVPVITARVTAARSVFNTQLDSVSTGSITAMQAMSTAVTEFTSAVAELSNTALFTATALRDEGVGLAAGAPGGALGELGPDFQAGGQGVWDDFLQRVDDLLAGGDDKLAHELDAFVGQLAQRIAQGGIKIDVHVQLRPHDERLFAIEPPSSVLASPLAAAEGGTAHTPQLLLLASMVETGAPVVSLAGLLAFGNASVELDYVTEAGTTSITGVPVDSTGKAVHSHVLGSSSGGPYRVDVLSGGQTVDHAGLRRASLQSASGLKSVRKQFRKLGRQDRKFFNKVTGQVRQALAQQLKATLKNHALGGLDGTQAVAEVGDSLASALGTLNLWRTVALGNSILFADAQLLLFDVPDEQIPDDFSAHGGGIYSMQRRLVDKKTEMRCRQLQAITTKAVAKLVKRDGALGLRANLVLGRGGVGQAPLVTTQNNPVVQLEGAPRILAGLLFTDLSGGSEGGPATSSVLIGRTSSVETQAVQTVEDMDSGQQAVSTDVVSTNLIYTLSSVEALPPLAPGAAWVFGLGPTALLPSARIALSSPADG